ncbi:hypothetical protein ACFQS7_17435 [Dankookia sp. GCM10030260]|uniref:hypothetical protein n=1 Tax=Dankookia sp. GCM10030260 TaxID=3273390 RepID=UPI0036238D28
MIRLMDEVEPPMLDLVPIKSLPHRETIEAVQKESDHLTACGSIRAMLHPVPVPATA